MDFDDKSASFSRSRASNGGEKMPGDADISYLPTSVGTSYAAKSSDAEPATKASAYDPKARCRFERCTNYSQGARCFGYCRKHYNANKDSIEEEARADGSWSCHCCGEENPSRYHRCSSCMGWRDGKHNSKATSAKLATSQASYANDISDEDKLLALQLQRQERDQYRRRGAATKVERFEPGGNPNVLDYGAPSSPSIAFIEDSKQEAPSSARSEGVPKAPKPKTVAKSTQDDKHNDQEAADAAFAARLAAMYEDPKFSSALENVKFGGRKREAVKMFQPGGDPRETNPTEDYNLPPAPSGEDVEVSSKRPKILSRKPGRVSKEEEARLMAAEEATQARLRDLMEGFGNVQEQAGEQSAPNGIGGVVEEEKSQQKIQIHMSLADLLSNPRSIDIDRQPTKVSMRCRPAVLDLTEEEAGEAERQLSELYGTNGSGSDDDIPSVGCMLSLVYGAKVKDSDEEKNTPKDDNEPRGHKELATVEECADVFSSIFESYLIEDGNSDVSFFTKNASESSSIDVSTELFMEHHSAYPIGSLIDIVGVMTMLKIDPRRGYDILDVLCALNIVQRVTTRARLQSESVVAKNSYTWNGLSSLSLFLAHIQQEAFKIHESEAKSRGAFEPVDRCYSRCDKTNDEDSPIMRSLGKTAVDLLMIVLVQKKSISILEANRRLNGTGANIRTQRRLHYATKVLVGLNIIKKVALGGKSFIKWAFHTPPAELPGLLKKWPSENNSGAGEKSRTLFLPNCSDRINVPTSVAKELPSMATHMLLFDSDCDDIVIGARAKVSPSDENSMLSKVISDDWTFWERQSLSSKGKPLDLAFLHRIMRPLLLKIRSSNQGGVVVTHRGRIKVMPFSLLDVLLQIRILQPYFVEGVIGRLRMFLEDDASNGEGFHFLLLEALHNVASGAGCRQYIFSKLRRLVDCFHGPARDRLVDEIVSVFSASTAKEQLEKIFSSAGGHPLRTTDNIYVAPSAALVATKPNFVEKSPFGNHDTMEARSCWAKNRKMQLAVRAERMRLLKVFDETKRANFDCVGDVSDFPRRSTRQIVPRGRRKDGALIFSENEMSLEGFLERRKLMRLVNQSFRRPYVEGVSKPALSQLDLSGNDVKELQNVFFDEDGSLRDDMKLEIDSGMKNDPRYIVFANIECNKERKDARWQVPIRHHGVGSQIINSRKKVEAILSKRNILIKDAEELDDIGLLFGGIEDQSLHHDTARQLTSWMKHRPLADQDEMVELEAIPGWEVDRLEYNAAMASPAAPGSLLVGLHGGESVFLGVQKDQVVRVGNDKCKIRNGKHDEILAIVRENDHLVVVEAKRGVMFTGDFPHAGVRNFSSESEEQRLMDKLKEKIAEIADRYPVHERVLRTKATVDMMANFPGLNKLCRLHCSTRMIKGGILVPDNSVGFDGCLPNDPDRRCFEDDVVEDDKEEVKVKAHPKRRKVSDSPQQRNISASGSKLHNIVTPDQDSVPRSYEGERIAKYFRKKLCFGTVQEHQAGGITALIRFDDGDFELCRLSELKNLVRLYSENEGDDEHANTKANDNECENKNNVKQARPVDGEVISIEADDSGKLFWRKESESKDVVVTTIVSGKPISTSMASLPGKSIGWKHTIVKEGRHSI